MKVYRIAALSAGLIFSLGLLTQAKDAKDMPESKGSSSSLKSTRDKASYAIGMDIGSSLKKQGLDLDPKILSDALATSYAGGKPMLSLEEASEAMKALQKEMVAKQALAGVKSKKDGEDYLIANKKKDGVKTLASGLQYKVIKEGAGKTPKLTDTVTTHYKGTLIDGTEFDSSYKRNEPATFPVQGVIPGWTEALQLMKEGSKWQLFIPANLAYGEQGHPPVIPPSSTLIFDIELIKVN